MSIGFQIPHSQINIEFEMNNDGEIKIHGI
jgi:hypothetical protein